MRDALVAFLLVVPVELPDKTFVATIVLGTRYRAGPVWLGVVAAFGVQCLVAVAAGNLLSRLPERPVQAVAAALFAIGAVVLLRAGKPQEGYVESVRSAPPRRAFVASFLLLFTAEWGDLSQLLTAGLVASGTPAVPVFLGSWVGLAVVSGAAVLLGRWLLRHVRLSLVRYIGAAVCAVLAVATLVGALSR